MNVATLSPMSQDLSSAGQYVSPKMWKDLTVDEKIERIRDEVKQLSQSIGYLQQTTNQIKNDFQNHDHINGKVVKDIKTYSESLGTATKLSKSVADEVAGNVYF